jgi:hypothetical protein
MSTGTRRPTSYSVHEHCSRPRAWVRQCHPMRSLRLVAIGLSYVAISQHRRAARRRAAPGDLGNLGFNSKLPNSFRRTRSTRPVKGGAAVPRTQDGRSSLKVATTGSLMSPHRPGNLFALHRASRAHIRTAKCGRCWGFGGHSWWCGALSLPRADRSVRSAEVEGRACWKLVKQTRAQNSQRRPNASVTL